MLSSLHLLKDMSNPPALLHCKSHISSLCKLSFSIHFCHILFLIFSVQERISSEMFTIPFPAVHSSDTICPYTHNQGFTQSSLSSLFLFFLQTKARSRTAAGFCLLISCSRIQNRRCCRCRRPQCPALPDGRSGRFCGAGGQSTCGTRNRRS